MKFTKAKLSSGMLAASLLAFSTTSSAVDLTVYTAVEAEDLQRYAETFNKDHPDINIKWVRDSTGARSSVNRGGMWPAGSSRSKDCTRGKALWMVRFCAGCAGQRQLWDGGGRSC